MRDMGDTGKLRDVGQCDKMEPRLGLVPVVTPLFEYGNNIKELYVGFVLNTLTCSVTIAKGS